MSLSQEAGSAEHRTPALLTGAASLPSAPPALLELAIANDGKAKIRTTSGKELTGSGNPQKMPDYAGHYAGIIHFADYAGKW